MNCLDRKKIAKADELIAEAYCLIDEVRGDLEQRVDNIMESFESGNHISEKLEEEQQVLEEAIENIETLQSGLEEVV